MGVQALSKDSEGYGELPSDDIAQLVRLVALVAPEHVLVFEAFGHRLIAGAATLSAAGRALLDAAFPGGAGPMFPSKTLLLEVLHSDSQQHSSGRSRSRKAARGSRSRDRSRHRKSRRRDGNASR